MTTIQFIIWWNIWWNVIGNQIKSYFLKNDEILLLFYNLVLIKSLKTKNTISSPKIGIGVKFGLAIEDKPFFQHKK